MEQKPAAPEVDQAAEQSGVHAHMRIDSTNNSGKMAGHDGLLPAAL